jgi:hypothetical protein
MTKNITLVIYKQQTAASCKGTCSSKQNRQQFELFTFTKYVYGDFEKRFNLMPINVQHSYHI